VIGGKWKPVILFHLNLGMKRNGELRRLIPDITQKMLTQQLRELERDGIVSRTVHATVPPRVDYALTAVGRSLEPVLHAMADWGRAHPADGGPVVVSDMASARSSDGHDSDGRVEARTTAP